MTFVLIRNRSIIPSQGLKSAFGKGNVFEKVCAELLKRPLHFLENYTIVS